MKNLSLKRIQKMKPYLPPLSGRRTFDGLLLDFNERTQSPSKNVQKALNDLINTPTLQVYPEYGQLEEKLAQYVGVDTDQIMLTDGSDRAIDIIFRTFTDAGDLVIIPTPSFAMFYQSAELVGNTIVTPAYDKKNMAFPTDEVLGAINEKTKLIVLCSPNNPTGTSIPLSDIEQIAKTASNSMILVDEAYFEFSKQTAAGLINKYPNIIVTRTFSKAFGLAALRIGYIIAAREYVAELAKVRGPYDVNMLAYTAAEAALDDLRTMQKYVDEVMDISKPQVEKFFTDNNIQYYKSSANLILFKPENPDIVEKILKENGILVRPQNKPGIEGSLRVTIGTVKQMQQFIKVYTGKIIGGTGDTGGRVSRQRAVATSTGGKETSGRIWKGTDSNQTKAKYAFLDRDGTLIFEPQDTYQIDSIEKLKILDGVIDGMKKLIAQGYTLIMISNQDGLGTDSFPTADFEKPQQAMLDIFKESGVEFAEIFVCGHLPEDGCTCRKPKTGLVDEFLKSNNMDLANSFVCGDRASDKQFAQNLGIRFIPMKTNGNFLDAIKPLID